MITSDRCYLPEAITHEVNGLLCDYDDLNEWTRLTLAVLDNLDSYSILGQTARQMSRRYALDRVAMDYLKRCRDLTDERQRDRRFDVPTRRSEP